MKVAATDSQEIQTSWHGAVTRRETPGLRERLYGLLDRPEGTTLRLDVRAVTSIDGSGLALLIGANHRAAAAGRRFVLVDSAGAVSQALSRMHVLSSFLVTQVIQGDIDLRRDPAGATAAAGRMHLR